MSGTLRLEELTKVFDDGDDEIVAVDGLSLDVDPGELLIFVGPSGCGKSTTLRCIAGLEDVTDGEIYINDENVTGRSATERDIAMVFQDYALYPHMTARKNMGFGLKMSTNLSKDEIDRKVEEVAATMGIEELLDSHPGELSGGQQQRVALGRAIVRDPAVFLMDEPLSNLDAKLRSQMRTEILSLQHELDVTTIYVTHNQTEAMTMGDRIAILDGGKLQQLGTPLECYHRPANTFVASFIGSPSMNLLTVEYDPDTGSLHHDAFEYPLSERSRAELGGGRRSLEFGIRPEDVELVSTAGDADVVVEASVIEPRGDVTYLTTTVGEHTFTVTLEGSAMANAGDRLGLGFDESDVYLFDAETGELELTHKTPESESISSLGDPAEGTGTRAD